MFTITYEIIDKCVGFVAGFKAENAIRFYDVRNSSFPNSLLQGSELEQSIMSHVKEGRTNKATSELLGVSNGTVSNYVAIHKRRLAFYYEFVAFLDYARVVLDLGVASVLSDVDDDFVTGCLRKEIFTVRDLFKVYTHNPSRVVGSISPRLTLNRKKRVFETIANLIKAIDSPVCYVIYLQSKQESFLDDDKHGYWTGSCFKSGGNMIPPCVKIANDARAFASREEAVLAGNNMVYDFPYALRFEVFGCPIAL